MPQLSVVKFNDTIDYKAFGLNLSVLTAKFRIYYARRELTDLTDKPMHQCGKLSKTGTGSLRGRDLQYREGKLLGHLIRSNTLRWLAGTLVGLYILLDTAGATPPPDPITYIGQFPTTPLTELTPAVLTIDSQNRDVLVYRPTPIAGVAPSLLIFFSGTGATLEHNITDEINPGVFRDLADAHQIVIVLPIPLSQSHGDWDNHSAGTEYWETALSDSIISAVSSNPDTNPDLLFTRALIKEAIIRYGVNADKVYVNGFSNGAFFSYFVAAVLNNRIAAFAETGGGLVLSNTTAGVDAMGASDPCSLPPYMSMDLAEIRECAPAGWLAGPPSTCSYAGAIPRPIAPSLVSRIPPGYMEANNDDTSVPFPHTCNLSAGLPLGTPHQTRISNSGISHAVNSSYLEDSWAFMSNIVFYNGFE